MTERWLPVVGHEGLYEVSDQGQVRSFRRREPRILSPVRASNGYLMINLGRGARSMVHRLVAAAFLGTSDLQVNHKNLDRGDNRLENLEYVTCSENHKHSHASGTRKQHARTRPVVLRSGASTQEFPSILAAAKDLGVSAGSIHSAIARQHKVRGLVAAWK